MRFILLFTLFFTSQWLLAQPQILSSKAIKSDSISAFNRVLPAENGDFYVAGYLTSPEKPYHLNAYFAKMNENGAVLWEKKIERKCDTRFIDFVISEKKELVLLLHETCEDKKKQYLSYLQKWDSLGNFIFEKPVNEGINLMSPLVILPSGEYMMGLYESHEINDSTVKTERGIIKFSENGTFLWKNTYQLNQENQVFCENSFVLLPNKKIVFVAASGLEAKLIDWSKYQELTHNVQLIYCNEVGEEERRTEIVTSANINNIYPTTDANVLILGYLYNKSDEIADMYVSKISLEKATSIWENIFHFYKTDVAHYAMEMPDNHYLISGTCIGNWHSKLKHTALVEIDGAGKTVWTKMLKDGDFIADGFLQKSGTYQLVGLCSESYKMPNETDYYLKKNEKYAASLLSLSENACIWDKNILIPGNEQAYLLEKAKKGGYFIAGIDFKGNDIFLLKADERGEILWRQELGDWSASIEVPVCLVATEDGGCLAMNNAGTLFCVSENGIKQWQSKEYNHQNVAGIIAADKGNYYLAGHVWKEYPDKALWLAKINAKGKILWEKEYDLALPIEVWSMAKTQDEGFIITGESGIIGETQVALIKIDKNGNLLWDKNFPLGKKANPKSITILNNGGYAIAGTSYSETEKHRAFLLITDEKGILKNTIISVKSDDEVAAPLVKTDNAGNIVFVATHEHSNYKGDQEIYVAKFDVKGEKLWEKSIGGGNSHYAGGLALSPDNQLIIVGYSNYLTHEDDANIYMAKVRNE